MILFKNQLPHALKLITASVILVFMASLFVSAPLQASDPAAAELEAAIPCNEQLALDAAKNSEKLKECVAKAKAMYPGRVVKTNVVSVNGCSTTIRGCTYTIYVYLSFPCPNPPFCPLAPDILVATVNVNCTFTVTNVDCHV